MKLTPCLELFFRDLPLHERIAAVKDCGYNAGEFWGHTNKDIPAIAAAAKSHDFTITSFTSSCGALLDDTQHDRYADCFKADLEVAQKLECSKIIILSGNIVKGKTHSSMMKSVINGLRILAPMAEKAGVTLVLELLNSAVNHPGYFLDNTDDITAAVRAANSPAIKVLYDIYHAGIMEGNLTEKILDNLDIIGHFHAAGIPGRNEMKDGEQNYPFICRKIDQAGYNGYMGLEYIPLKDSAVSLKETLEWLS